MRLAALCLLATFLTAPAFAATPVGTALPLHIGGRVVPVSDDDPAQGYRHQWPGTYFEARFRGTEVHLRLNDDVNRFNVYVDGQLVNTPSRPGEGDIVLGPFAPGEHTIRAEKLNESWGAAQFTGFFVSDPANVLPAPEALPREIEFIGDSYTVGYGNTSPTRDCPGGQVWATTDTQLAFGPVTAKHFNADYRINAISGRGVVRNYNGGDGLHLPQAYAYTVQPDMIDSADWRPQIIVIGLGTNDFSTPLHGGEVWTTRDELHSDYEQTYVQFVQTLRAENPQAFFLLMATDQANGEIQAEVRKVLTALRSDGESRIDFLPMNNLSFGACDWHLTTADDARVASGLIAWIDAHPDLWDHKKE
ncbi:MAG: SGNH/GDSL hydrolase family protein [Asticcacaulis sp.]|uniref:SGNH/GDSL hydrolase family protein n=1 Tax=Asticcacaulis sp. TaxID=1872648 RepID=UPI0039E5804D